MGELPTLTVAIPAYNEEHHIARSIVSALDQAIGDGVDVLVCDDGSTDATARIAHDLARGTDSLRVIQNDTNRGMLPTTERLFCEARGEVVLRLDADCVLDDGLIRHVREAIADGADVVYGRVAVGNPDALHPAACAVGKAAGRGARHGGACVAVRRSAVDLTELEQNVERELRYQATAAGLEVRHLDDCGVASDFPTSCRDWLPRKYRSGAVYLRETAPTPSAFRWRELRGPAFWTGLVGGSVAAAVAGYALFAALLWLVVGPLYARGAVAVARVSGRPELAAVYPLYRAVGGIARTAGVWANLGTLGRIVRGRRAPS